MSSCKACRTVVGYQDALCWPCSRRRIVILSRGFTSMQVIANEVARMAAGGEISEFLCSADERIPAIRAAIELLESEGDNG